MPRVDTRRCLGYIGTGFSALVRNGRTVIGIISDRFEIFFCVLRYTVVNVPHPFNVTDILTGKLIAVVMTCCHFWYIA